MILLILSERGRDEAAFKALKPEVAGAGDPAPVSGKFPCWP
ncbi:hypothetical protein [Allorhizobium sonneratiae]|nr:hypothetical protein [Allorhizobium sonneratiae]